MTTPSDRLLVSEIFESVQGEGVSLGVPSVFLRLAHCNLRCGWCDTKYTWDWHTYDIRKEVREYSLDQTVDTLQRLRPRNLVVTGGEPLLQQTALVSLLRRLGRDWTSEVETAGTLVPDAQLTAIITRWNVSPKLGNSGNPTDKRLRPEALRAFAALPNASFKFVLAATADLAEVSDLVDALRSALRAGHADARSDRGRAAERSGPGLSRGVYTVRLPTQLSPPRRPVGG